MHNLNLSHTILYRDIDTIYKLGLKPKKSKKMIACDYKYYFYDDENALNEDFENLISYLKKLNENNLNN